MGVFRVYAKNVYFSLFNPVLYIMLYNYSVHVLKIVFTSLFYDTFNAQREIAKLEQGNR